MSDWVGEPPARPEPMTPTPFRDGYLRRLVERWPWLAVEHQAAIREILLPVFTERVAPAERPTSELELSGIERYALEIVANGAENSAEDDLDEDGQLGSEEEWNAATDLALRIAHGIRANPAVVLGLAAPREEPGAADGGDSF